jgi:hypothetical protein
MYPFRISVVLIFILIIFVVSFQIHICSPCIVVFPSHSTPYSLTSAVVTAAVNNLRIIQPKFFRGEGIVHATKHHIIKAYRGVKVKFLLLLISILEGITSSTVQPLQSQGTELKVRFV